jgi:hypothetical protein
MNPQYESIFRKAMVSQNSQAVLRVARAFEDMNDIRGTLLRERILTVGFGAMARGTPIKGTDGAVIPPGRYWQDIIGETHRSKWLNFTLDHPEVTVEKTEWSGPAENLVMSVIFLIPPTANNYGLPGVHYPTNVLGFPTIADTTVQGVKDTVQRPPPMTSMQALAETPNIIGQTVGKAVSETAKGISQGLGVSTSTLVMAGIAGIASLILLNRFMMPKLPI